MSENGEDTSVKSENEHAGSGDENDEQENDPHYDPIISLPEMEVPALEEDEIVMLTLRAKIYRYDSQEDPPEWKERGTGDIKMLHHKGKGTVRVVMRRDKTFKLCANHFITPQMDLKPSPSCDRAWVYCVKADYIDGTVKSHLLALKFANIEKAQKWKDTWDEAKEIVAKSGSANNEAPEEEKKIISEDALKINDSLDEEKKNNSLDLPVKEETEQSKTSSTEVTEKLISLNIRENDEEKSS